MNTQTGALVTRLSGVKAFLSISVILGLIALPACAVNIEMAASTAQFYGLDVQSYARHFGISEQDATKCLSLELDAGKLDEELSRNESETFGGLWIEHEPAFGIVALFTRNGQVTLDRYVSDELRTITEVRTCGSSLKELSSIQTEVLADLRSLNIPVDTYVDIYKGKVVVKTSKSGHILLTDAIETGKIELPDSVDVTAVEGLASPLCSNE